MPLRLKLAAFVSVFSALLACERGAWACGPNETQQYASALTIWCIDDTVWANEQSAFQNTFFAYGDAVVEELESLFGVTPQGLPLIIEAVAPDGGAQTPPKCCGNGCNQNPCLGEAVTGDAYTNNAYNVQGFWGYLLTLHELVNQWTGYVSGGWPTDFWADHVSAFPNSMDWQIMAALGAKLNDANLTAASAAQKARFYPGGDSVDPRVPMFDQIFALPNMGFAGWTRIFGYVRGDAMSWDGLGAANPAELRTAYVVAYVSLGPGQSVLPILQSANVANGMPDGVQGDATYTVPESDVDAIASAHCAIAAASAQGLDVTTDQQLFLSGNFAAVTAAGACGTGCPSECGCKTTTNRCVAPWLADSVPDAGAGDGGAIHGSGDAGGSGGAPDAGLGGLDAGGHDAGSSGGGGVPGGATAMTGGCHSSPDDLDGNGASILIIPGFAGLALLRSRRRRR